MLKTSEARDRIEAEFAINVTTQTVTQWVRTGKVPGMKLGGRYYVDWIALVAHLHDRDDSTAG
jgi:hypothetical protein